jgi:hypothetical protein
MGASHLRGLAAGGTHAWGGQLFAADRENSGHFVGKSFYTVPIKKLRHRFLPGTLRKVFLHEIMSISAIQGLWREAGTVNANGEAT